jgi:hypothetical protein
MTEGKIVDPTNWIKKVILPSATAWLKKVDIYSEKDYVYGPLIPFLYKVFDCKFVFIKRDGRDVVKSMINQHEQLTGCCYRECKEPSKMTDKALKNHKRYEKNDVCDYSRPRPSASHFLYEEWSELTRAEMCAFYWAKVNEIHLKELRKLPADKWFTVDYSSDNLSQNVLQMVDFLGLEGLDESKVVDLLNRKINSMLYRGASVGRYQHWSAWDANTAEKFYRIAGDVMKELGYNG